MEPESELGLHRAVACVLHSVLAASAFACWATSPSPISLLPAYRYNATSFFKSMLPWFPHPGLLSETASQNKPHLPWIAASNLYSTGNTWHHGCLSSCSLEVEKGNQSRRVGGKHGGIQREVGKRREVRERAGGQGSVRAQVDSEEAPHTESISGLTWRPQEHQGKTTGLRDISVLPVMKRLPRKAGQEFSGLQRKRGKGQLERQRRGYKTEG